MHEVVEAHEAHGAHGGSEDDPLVIRVAVTMAILAVLVALATLLGHRAHTEEVLLEAKANDQWAYYQAKNSRSHEMEGVADMLGTFVTADKEKAAKLQEKYNKQAARYEHEKEEAGEKAQEFEKEKDLVSHRADRFDGAEVLLEIGLIVCSLTLLTRNRLYWFSGIVLGVLGVVVAVTGFLVRS